MNSAQFINDALVQEIRTKMQDEQTAADLQRLFPTWFPSGFEKLSDDKLRQILDLIYRS